MDREFLHDKIEAYLTRQMSVAERDLFEKEIATDNTMQAEVARHRKAAAALQYGLHKEMKRHLAGIEQGLQRRTRRIRTVSRLAVAASVFLIMAAGTYFYAQHNYRDTSIAQDMFAATQTEVFRGGEQAVPVDQRFAEAESLFRSGHYDQARLNYLEIQKEDTLLKSKAEWNLLLCYLATDPESSQFRIMFDHILQDSTHDYHNRAVSLQDRLGGIWYRLVN
jgi:hypothetical protein